MVHRVSKVQIRLCKKHPNQSIFELKTTAFECLKSHYDVDSLITKLSLIFDTKKTIDIKKPKHKVFLTPMYLM